jgi:hypothetical protein
LRVRLGRSSKKEAAVKNGSDSDVRPPDAILRLEGFAGDGRDLQSAVTDAWQNATKRSESRAYRIQEVFVWGENPISGYRVIITPVT